MATSPAIINPGGIFLLALLAAGCGSQVARLEPPRRSAIPGVGWIDTGRGEVKYPIEGWDWVVAARRRSAFRRIAKACAGMKFNVTQEATRKNMEVRYSQTDVSENLARGLDHYDVNPFRFIAFECAPQEEKKP